MDESSNATANQTTVSKMQSILEKQKASFLSEGPVPFETRIDRLDRMIALSLENQERLCTTLSKDFGHRSFQNTRMTEIAAPIMGIRHAKQHLRRWMKDEKRKLPLLFSLLGAKAYVHYQPLGSVGIIVPWNFPIYLTMGPLTGVIAAGNRAMIKPSEFTPRTSDLLAELFARYFDSTEVAVIPGGVDVSTAFSELPFDHLVFTGATAIASHVLRAAAKNLVPVTLELGGKSPVIIARDADLEKAATAILDFKLTNAGQICISPDYLLVPEENLRETVSALETTAARLFPKLLDNPDYTSIVNERHFRRLRGYLEEAKNAGVEIIEINPAGEDFADQPYFKLAPALLIEPSDERLIMREEIFGPLLPIKTYRDIDEAIAYINRHPRPLAMYYFGDPKSTDAQRALSHTISGGITFNDTAAHAGCESLPFGGVGPSGTGAYHGFDGFKRFSHARGVYQQSKINLADLFGVRAPYDSKYEKALDRILK